MYIYIYLYIFGILQLPTTGIHNSIVARQFPVARAVLELFLALVPFLWCAGAPNSTWVRNREEDEGTTCYHRKSDLEWFGHFFYLFLQIDLLFIGSKSLFNLYTLTLRPGVEKIIKATWENIQKSIGSKVCRVRSASAAQVAFCGPGSRPEMGGSILDAPGCQWR